MSTSTFLGNKNLQFEAFVAAHTESVHGEVTTLADRSARGVRLNYPNDVWQAHVSLRGRALPGYRHDGDASLLPDDFPAVRPERTLFD